MSSKTCVVTGLKIETSSFALMPVTAKFAIIAPAEKLIEDVAGRVPLGHRVIKPPVRGLTAVRLQYAAVAAISKLARLTSIVCPASSRPAESRFPLGFLMLARPFAVRVSKFLCGVIGTSWFATEDVYTKPKNGPPVPPAV
jgi:hypothetical protein